MEALQQRQALLQGEDGRQAGLPLGLRQQGHHPLGPSSQPRLQAPRPGGPGAAAAAAAPLPPAGLQLVLQAHQHLAEQVGEEDVQEDEEASPGAGRDAALGGVHLDDGDVFLSQGLFTCGDITAVPRSGWEHDWSIKSSPDQTRTAQVKEKDNKTEFASASVEQQYSYFCEY